MFIGRYEHTIDDKGRLTIPARFREDLEGGAYLTLGFDTNLYVLTPAAFEAISEQINQTSITDDDARVLKRLIYSNAERVELDRSGRILIPLWLRQAAQIDSTVVIAGSGRYFEIWSPELWAVQNAKLQDSGVNSRRFNAFNVSV